MQFYEKPIPEYLTRKGNLIRLVIFTAIFALAFINIYDPFKVDTYLEISGIMLFLYSSFVILTGIGVVVPQLPYIHFVGIYRNTGDGFRIFNICEIYSVGCT